eukprot:91673-Heterocapsa_arctica.AAC.1
MPYMHMSPLTLCTSGCSVTSCAKSVSMLHVSSGVSWTKARSRTGGARAPPGPAPRTPPAVSCATSAVAAC